MATQIHKTLAILGGLGTLVHAEHTAELACHLCEDGDTELVLAYVIVVPHSLPLDAPLLDQERAAQDAIDQGLCVAHRRGCQVQARVVRHRHAAEAVLELARAEGIDKIVLGVRVNLNVPHEYDTAETAETEILRSAKCEVIVDHEPVAA